MTFLLVVLGLCLLALVVLIGTLVWRDRHVDDYWEQMRRESVGDSDLAPRRDL